MLSSFPSFLSTRRKSFHPSLNIKSKKCTHSTCSSSHPHNASPTQEGELQRFQQFERELQQIIKNENISKKEIERLAYGTDASFYRLIPKAVVHLHTEEEVQRILPLAAKHQVPVTFRAAGTSLSGQAITDSVLLKLKTGEWRDYTIHHSPSSPAHRITLQPGLIGGEVNRILAKYGRKIGPDPSSIDSCMIGGIASNNSSGMCCGVLQNTYHTMHDIRVVLVDGTVLDTCDVESRKRFEQSHSSLLSSLSLLRQRILSHPSLPSLISRKFSIKCTTGYSINALIDFEDPIDILAHLMIGSEGTLGFISRITYNTLDDHPHKASSFMMFPNIHMACEVASILKQSNLVDAAELMDRPSLRSAQLQSSRHPPSSLSSSPSFDPLAFLSDIPSDDQFTSALLVEVRAPSSSLLLQKIADVTNLINRHSNIIPLHPIHFTSDPQIFNRYWDVRKGLIPLIGGLREPGTTFLMEDVATAVEKLARMSEDIRSVFNRYSYDDAVLFGHALDGNLHLAFTQQFNSPANIERYSAMMNSLCELVVSKYDGSLKAEHGTGRNVAPYVQMEWGNDAYDLMWEIKHILDPLNVLNRGVLLNSNPRVHLENIKPMPIAHPIIDKCIECGFCESLCPSRALTLTPRQRIASFREITRLKDTGEDAQRLNEMENDFAYYGDSTCAADGLCAEKCPVSINTGHLIKHLRSTHSTPLQRSFALFLSSNFNLLEGMGRGVLTFADLLHRFLGPRSLSLLSYFSSQSIGRLFPSLAYHWNPFIPPPSPPLSSFFPSPPTISPGDRVVVYVPSCTSRMMGLARGDKEQRSVYEVTKRVLEKAGFKVVVPDQISSLCCGASFEGRGLIDAADQSTSLLMQQLLLASDNGRYPILFDSSPCAFRMKEIGPQFADNSAYQTLQFSLFDPIQFTVSFLFSRLRWHKYSAGEEGKPLKICVHVPCGSKKMKLTEKMLEIARRCADDVEESGISCCGMAGDRGLKFPLLPSSASRSLSLSPNTLAFSTNRTCELSLSLQSNVHFHHLFHMIDSSTSPL